MYIYFLSNKLYISIKNNACLPLLKYILNILSVFVYLGFNVAFNTVQVISRRVVGRAEETST